MDCMLVMQAAGIPGPYFPHTNHYSKTCLANTIVGVKLTADSALEGAKNVAGKLGQRRGGKDNVRGSRLSGRYNQSLYGV
jgi:hypothetical protein